VPDGVSTTNLDGKYVPAIPLPFYTSTRFLQRKRFACSVPGGSCPFVAKTEVEYRGHYALAHILRLR